MDEYVDVEFEGITGELRDAICAATAAAEGSAERGQLEVVLQNVCRALRESKLQYLSLLPYVGIRYRHEWSDFVMLAEQASDLAKLYGSKLVAHGINRHYQKIISALTHARREGQQHDSVAPRTRK